MKGKNKNMKKYSTKKALVNLLMHDGEFYERAWAIVEAIEAQGGNIIDFKFQNANDIHSRYSVRTMGDIIHDNNLAQIILDETGEEDINEISDKFLEVWINKELNLNDIYPNNIGIFNRYLVCNN